MDRIERIEPRPPSWVRATLEPDRDEIARRRRREDEERRRRERRGEGEPHPPVDGDPPHHVDVRA